MKKWSTALLSLVLFAITAIFPAHAADLRVTVDGKAVQFTDANPYIDENGRTMMPLRAVGEALGYQVKWIPQNEIAHLYRYTRHSFSPVSDYEFQLSEKYPNLQQVSYEDIFLKKNKNEICWMYLADTVSNRTPIPEVSSVSGLMTYRMDTKTVVRDGRTYIPLRALVGVMMEPVSIEWNRSTQTVQLTHTSAKPHDDSWHDRNPLPETVYWLPDSLIPAVGF